MAGGEAFNNSVRLHFFKRSGKTLSTENCSSPENEHAELIRELEAKYAEDIKPIRNLTKNFHVSLDVLEKYVYQIRSAWSDTINFANAGIILQSSKEVYARKVDYLEKLFDEFQRLAHSVRWKDEQKEKEEEAKRAEQIDEREGSGRQKTKNSRFAGLDKFKFVHKKEIQVLPEDVQFNLRDGPRTSHIPRMHPCFLPPTHNIDVFLTDSRGEQMGRKYDFRVNWPVNNEGVPIDLECGGTLAEKTDATSDLDLSDDDDSIQDGQFDDTFTGQDETVIENTLRFDDMQPDGGVLTSTPFKKIRIDTTNPKHEIYKCWVVVAPLEFSQEASKYLPSQLSVHHPPEQTEIHGPDRPQVQLPELLDFNKPQGADEVITPAERPKREKKLPAKMTLVEFLYGKKKGTESAAKKTKMREKKIKVKTARKRKATALEDNDGQPPTESETPSAQPAENETPKLNGSVDPDVQTCKDSNSQLNEHPAEPPPNKETQLDCDTDVFDDPIAYSPLPTLGECDLGDIEQPPNVALLELTVGSVGESTIRDLSADYDALELDPLTKRVREWENKITPILDELDRRPKFRLAENAKSIVKNLTVGESVPLSNVIASRRPHEVSRNFVALLHLCNSKNVELNDQTVTLLNTEFRLSAENDTDFY